MENNIRFRNHISIVLEQLGVAFSAVFVILLTNLDEFADFLETGVTGKEKWGVIIGVGGIFGIFLLVIVYQLILWNRTYISVCDNSIVIERNTINRKKNTIGIKNISNVNTEQNLFEMVMGTCKVKLDTNSMSTSDQTDVKIVLKKTEAEKFRLYLMKLMRMEAGEDVETAEAEEEHMDWSVKAELSDILIHGFFSINLISVLVLMGCIVGVVEMISIAMETVGEGGSAASVLLSFVMVFFVFITALWDIIKGFVRYYDFKIARKNDKLYIRYGFLKKVNYIIPVDKVNALKLKQSALARITGRYMAEIINIGMGDDTGETESFLFPYSKKRQIEERMEALLPEFSEVVGEKTVRQPKGVWIAWIWPTFLWVVTAAVAAGVLSIYMPKYREWIMYGTIGMSLWLFLLMILCYMTCGTVLTKDYMLVARGYFGKTYCYISYRKIQYVRFSQNCFAKLTGIQKGTAYLLASAANREQALPYIGKNEADAIKDRMLE